MSQFMEVIEWLDSTGEELVHRVPEDGSGETKFGAQLIVRDSQAAVFFRDGKGLDVVGPGRHTLSTLNLPILTKVLSLPWGFTSPFRAEVYFVNLKVFTSLRWGTKDPVAFKDRELGLVRLRAFGAFTVRITQPLLFVNMLVGTQGSFATSEIEDYLREVIVSRLNDFLGERVESILDLPSQYDEMGVAVKERLENDFTKYGIELVDFLINRITPPDDVQQMIDARSGMGAVGNLNDFLKFKAARGLDEGGAGSDGTGAAASGMGLGVGAGLGMMLPGLLFKSIRDQATELDDIVAGGVVHCDECHGEVRIDARFCAHCGHQMVVIKKCPSCDKNVTAQAKFCSSCGLEVGAELHCTQCDTKLPAGTRFCFHCGERVGAAPETPPTP